MNPEANPKISVLLIDDEPNIGEITKLYLENKFGGFTVTLVYDGESALEILRTHDFEVIVSDYEMPEISGLDILHSIRARGDTTPFVIWTGKSRHEVVIKALNEGADFYLQKGEDPMTLFTEMKQVLVQIVEKRRIGRALNESQVLLSEIIDFLPDATIALDTSHKVIAWNRAMEHLTGISTERIYGKQIEYEKCIEQYPEITPLLGSILKNGSIILSDTENSFSRGEEYNEEFLINIREKPRYFLITVSAILNPDFEKAGFIGSIRDVTSQKSAELAVLESRENYRKLVENNRDIIMRFDANGRHIYVSPAINQYIPINYRFLIGKRYSDLNLPDGIGALWDSYIDTVINTGAPIEVDICFPSSNGEIFFNWRLFPESDTEGKVRSVLSISRDVTFQKEFEKEKQTLLIQIERNLAELAILNDGIRNPLAVITGLLSIMDSLQDSEREALYTQVLQIDQMISQLDRRWVESENVLGFLRRHYSIEDRSDSRMRNP